MSNDATDPKETLGSAIVQVLIGPPENDVQLWLEVARVQLNMTIVTKDGGGTLAATQTHTMAAPMTGLFRVAYKAGNITAEPTTLAVEVEKGGDIQIGIAPAGDV